MADDEASRDPFAAQPRCLHPAIGKEPEASTSIEPRLFANFFATSGYTQWATGTKPWQLHCSGGPGCGKTELAAATAQRLRKTQGQTSPVLTLFMNEDVVSPSLIFIEDFWNSINDQLGTTAIPSAQYPKACEEGQPIKDRIAALERDIGARISTESPKTHAYLIIDGYDCINESLQTIIEQSFTKLHEHGLRVFATRRVRAFAAPINAICDGCGKKNMNHYWMCSECQKKEMASWYWLCYSCLDQRRACAKCPEPGEDFVENKPYINVQLTMDGSDLSNYISVELQREFRTVQPDTWQQVTDYILGKSGDNITLVRLYLDNILNQETLDGFDSDRVSDRLPANVIAFFDTELEDLEAQPKKLRDLAVLSILIASTNEHGVPIGDFEKILRPNIAPLRSVEEMLCAARGWIVQQEWDEIGLYSPVFELYVTEDYNEKLTQARIKLLMKDVEEEEEENEGETSMITEMNLKLSQYQTQAKQRPALAESKIINSDDSIGTIGTLPSLSSSIDTSDSLFSRQSSVWNNRPPFNTLGRTSSHASGSNVKSIPTRLCSILDEEHFTSPARMDSGDLLDSPFGLETPITKLLPELSVRQDTGLAQVSQQKVPEPPLRICTFCHDSILSSGRTSGDHHSSPKNAKASTTHCIFCEALYTKGSSQVSSTFHWRRYTWTIRSSAQARSGIRSNILTFRPAPNSLYTLPKQFHCFPSDSLTIASPSSLGPNTSPTHTAAQIKSWIQTCNASHPCCHRPPNPSFIPTRLLDLQSPNPTLIRLVNTAYEKIDEPYCTLSHSWGSSKFITTTLWNVERHLLSGVPWADLPKNFQEAIEVVKTLRVRYIWIDSLCIIQDPPGDFKTQGALMHAVYRNSYCNIVAADSLDSTGGLFRSRDAGLLVPAAYTVPHIAPSTRPSIFGHQGQEWCILPTDLWPTQLLRRNFIYTRGWVFQERILSPRLLHFASSQIFWDCASISACETLPSGLPTPLDTIAATDRHWRGRLAFSSPLRALSGPIDNESPYTFWDTAVTAYTSCALTSQADKGLAIWSIAKILRDMTGEAYAVGMWSKHLAEQLAWQVDDTQKSYRVAKLQEENPSWAWMSVMGVVRPCSRLAERVYRVCGHDGGELAFEARDTNQGRDQMPVLAERALAVRGCIHSGRVKRAGGEGKWKWEFDSKKAMIDAFPDEDPEGKDEVYEHCGILLLAASVVRDEEDDGSEVEKDEDEERDSIVSDTDDVIDTNEEQEQELELEEQDPRAKSDLSTPTSSIPHTPFGTKTYHGIGLLLAPLPHYLSLQKRRLPILEASHTLSVQRHPPCCGTWPCAAKVEIDWIKKIFKTEKKEEREVYRRIGIVKFRDITKNMYAMLVGKKKKNIWLE